MNRNNIIYTLQVIMFSALMVLLFMMLFQFDNNRQQAEEWQSLYWAPYEPVIDEEGVPLLGRVVDGVIEIARDE